MRPESLKVEKSEKEKLYQLGKKIAGGVDYVTATLKGVEFTEDGTLIGKQVGPGKITEWVNARHAESSKKINNEIQGIEDSLAERMGNTDGLGKVVSEVKNVEITIPLSKRNSEHIRQHTLDSVIKQSKYLDDAKLAQKLAKDSYFNPDWNLEEVNKYAEIAYNDLLNQGKRGRLEYEINGEILDVFIHPDGKFGSVYGRYKYTVEDIRDLTK
ncbi:hypothetical protein [Bacillus pseudomycoides]|uniref:hypothetical protein n=1 Tax=Bacillus pseudomycoides TaxID=64104 RepID=UPI0020D218D5|nr:hypothetical protein [Bacillus pseudomycoides]MED1619954.1 hypothetical protein [Bacillus pseudomycoides]